MEIRAAVRLTREDDVIVATIEGSNVSTYGDSVHEALDHLGDAVDVYLSGIAEQRGESAVYEWAGRVALAHDTMYRRARRQYYAHAILWTLHRVASRLKFERLSVPLPRTCAA